MKITLKYLMDEHEEIVKFTDRLETECLKILNGNEINEDFFRASIEFIRKFADGLHHKKEEDILFRYMEEYLGPAGEKLIRSGMLVEHTLARGYVLNLETYLNKYIEKKSDLSKLQILSNSMGYVNLLRDHATKENDVVYTFADRMLSDELKEKIENEMKIAIDNEKEALKYKEELKKKIF